MSLVLSLFPGLELLDSAFREVGFCVVSGPDRVTGGDVRAFRAPAGVFDGVIGGSPCQSFSALANLVRARGWQPRYGNLVPEFERVVVEAVPRWFLHENVPAAAVPHVEGYAVHDFVICNSAIEGDDGLGQEQERVRRFAFGVRGNEAISLLRWIPRAALRLPATERAVHSRTPPYPKSKRGRVGSVRAGSELGPTVKHQRVRVPPITGENGSRVETRPERLRQRGVVGARGYAISPAQLEKNRAAGVRGERRPLAEMCRLQGYDPAILEDCPFTADAKRRLVANGVPRPLGLAVARAVMAALETLR